MPAATPSPTVRRRRLAAELRKLRESSEMTCEEVAERLECSPSKISRMETGRVSIHPRDVRDLLNLYQTNEQQRAELLKIARQARERGWWQTYDAVLQKNHQIYIGLEEEACWVREYEPQFVPGLLQTEAYALAVKNRPALRRPDEELDQFVAARMARKQLLTRDNSINMWAILDEPVIRRMVGGPAILRDQLEHILEVSLLPNVEIQVLPFSAGAHAGMEGPFVIMEFPEPADPDIVYLENLTSSLYVEEAVHVARYRMVFGDLIAAAISPDDSRELITEVASTLA